MRYTPSLLFFAVFAAGLGVATPTISRGASPDAMVSVVTDHALYRLGQEPRIRITVKNLSSGAIFVPNVSAPAITAMTITDASGAEVPKNLPPQGFAGDISILTIAPGSALDLFTEEYEPRTIWIPLSGWSYKLTKPGSYKIVVKLPNYPQSYANGFPSTNAPSVTVQQAAPVQIAVEAAKQ